MSFFRARARYLAVCVAATATGTTYYSSSNKPHQPLPLMTKPTKDHHYNGGFRNPWDSALPNTFVSTFKMITQLNLRKVEAGITPASKPPAVEKMNWELINDPSIAEKDAIVSTWLGHACTLVQLNGLNILLDPIFSDRCSPLSFAGPKRYTPPPCDLKDLPRIDAVVISHNHYDHLDADTIQELAQRHPEARFYVPLGNKAWFNLDDNSRVEELDWWDETVLSSRDSKSATVKITCTPCQHFSGRGIFDRNKTLWASWCFEGIKDGQSKGKVFFGGDTGYRAVPPGTDPEKEYDAEYLDTLPHCPAFKEIGDRIGPFDLALIPIGAYSPRWFMSSVHCSPEDAVRVHEDIKSRRSIGIHWGTFVLTNEPVNEPPKRLQAALKSRGHDTNDFTVLMLGETLVTQI